ncbi:putative phosphomutase [Maudiozyma humilis]|uniref:Phosphomutase n=1 Tax=Maudiozyma humilis TaxID=51915 RepID=A0AAV5RR59_MAUHU|nr:putative phosphomutase [Kazachstania humilis]
MKFTAEPGYFSSFATPGQEALDSTVDDHNVLIAHPDWKQLYDAIPADTPSTQYKLLILARHGQGYHNYSMEKYGVQQWDDYWAMLDGDDGGSWLDAHLTALGKDQVRDTGRTVLLPLVQQLGFLPHRFFNSPMRRCLETFAYSWGQVLASEPHTLTRSGSTTVTNTVIENLRENLGSHTCDKRVPHSEALAEYTDYAIPAASPGTTVNWVYEQPYPEEDALWEEEHRETPDEMDVRTRKGLETLFAHAADPRDKFLSLTVHEGVIKSVLRNLEHPGVKNLQTSKTVAVVVKVTL